MDKFLLPKAPSMPQTWLLIDTACPRAMLALVREGEVIAECYLSEQQKHGEQLGGAIEKLLAGAGLGLGDLMAIAVGTGPGSFIGVRIAMAHAKGLSLALGLPLVGFSTLAAIDPKGAQYVAIDAKRSEFYVWQVGSPESPCLVGEIPGNACLELDGPVASKALELLPVVLQDEGMNLVPQYIRNRVC